MFLHAVSAVVARRLAEVAACYTNFEMVYLISQYQFPDLDQGFPEPEIYGFSNLADAEKYANSHELHESEWGIFGPFKTAQDVPVKWDNDKKNIQKVTFTVYSKKAGKEIVEEFDIDKAIDTIFFNLVSFDMFAMPYYTKLYGVNYAKKLRDYVVNEYKNKGENGLVTLLLWHRVTKMKIKGPKK